MSLFWKIFAWFWAAMVLMGAALLGVVTATRPDPLPASWREATSHSLSVYGATAAESWEKSGAPALRVSLQQLRRQAQAHLWLYDAAGRSLLPQPDAAERGPQPPFGALPFDEPLGGNTSGGNPSNGNGGPRDGPHDGDGPHSGFDWPNEFRPGRGPMPPAMQAQVAVLARRVLNDKTGATQFEMAGPMVRLAQRVSGPSGKRYALAGEMRVPREGRIPLDATALALRVLAVLATGTLLCYGLARSLTRPIVVLQDATRRLAKGDLTARIGGREKQRDELAALGRDFDLMAERIETLITSQRRLLGDVSHELRSPLTRLGVALALARHEAAKAEPGDGEASMLATHFDRIGCESGRLNELIGQVLQLTRLESGLEGAVAGRSEIDLAKLVKGVAEDADFEAQQRGRGVRVTRCEPCRVRGDETLLRSAVENVVRNAIRYTPQGTTVELTLDISPPTADEAHPLGEAIITVRDRGEGVPKAALSELFKPFYRVESARDRDSGGVGLGLAITERAVLSHGGRARAINAPDGGLQVELRLPLAERDAA